MGIMNTNVCGIKFDNPLIIASGPCGNGEELNKYVPIKNFGGFTFKTITKNKKDGNPTPRILSVDSGIINSVGLQNEGINNFVKKISLYNTYETNTILSIGADNSNDIKEIINKTQELNNKIYEINLSCPNIHDNGKILSEDLWKVREIVKTAKNCTNKPVFVKVAATDNINTVCETAIYAGADGITAINTIKGMKIDIKSKKPFLKRKIGGLSGAAIKPIGIYNVYKIRKEFPDIPIIASGGVFNYKDLLEYIMVGADLVSIGTAMMIDYNLSTKIIENLEKYLLNENIKLSEIKSCID